MFLMLFFFFFSSRRRHTRFDCDWSSDVCSSDLAMSRWTAAAGALVVSLDSMMNIAFPAIATAFAAPAERVRWIIICYVLTYAITSFAGGAAADRLEHVAVFRTGVALSVVAFVMGRAAAGFGGLLVARVVQGFAGGLLYGTPPALSTP